MIGDKVISTDFLDFIVPNRLVMCVQPAHNIPYPFLEPGMNTSTIKASRLNIRCDHRARQLLDKAAAYTHVSVSEFVLSHALASAEQVVQAHESISLNPMDFQAFLAALDVPVEANEALNRAFIRHAEQVRK
ncbi:MAG: DUF1778 domain-containing protein [Methylococcaceae bacterium]|nr:DUF1778 domain-containing protein [Methylococcaceae bacterium]